MRLFSNADTITYNRQSN